MFICGRFLFSSARKRSVFRICKAAFSRKPARSMYLSRSLEDFNIKSTADWGHFRQHILSAKTDVNSHNIDAMTVGLCTAEQKYDLGLLYCEYLQEANIQLNLATMGKYLKLLYLAHKDTELDEKTERKILELCELIKIKHSVLDNITLDSLIQAISLTKNWRLGLKYLEEIKLLSQPTSAAFCALIAAAFLNNDRELGWSLWTLLLEQQDKVVYSTVYRAYFHQLKKKQQPVSDIKTLFSFLHNHNARIHHDSVDTFIAALESVGKSVKSSLCNNRGVCQACGSQLNIFEPTKEQFADLKEKIFQKVIIGNNIFNKTTPHEVERFKQFIFESAGFDVIIDGLNVAYSVGVKQTPQVFSHLVAAVVHHFVNQGKKVLVFGRSHMNRWPKENWRFIQQNATLFLTENLSQEDPYLLYAALHSGKNTIIVSRDLMRNHKFLLKDADLRNSFEKWMLQHQYQLVKILPSGRPLFKKPQAFSHIAQQNGQYWHIPHMQKEDNEDNLFLCIKMTTK